jgi:hypothetical protein
VPVLQISEMSDHGHEKRSCPGMLLLIEDMRGTDICARAQVINHDQ